MFFFHPFTCTGLQTLSGRRGGTRTGLKRRGRGAGRGSPPGKACQGDSAGQDVGRGTRGLRALNLPRRRRSHSRLCAGTPDPRFKHGGLCCKQSTSSRPYCAAQRTVLSLILQYPTQGRVQKRTDVCVHRTESPGGTPDTTPPGKLLRSAATREASRKEIPDAERRYLTRGHLTHQRQHPLLASAAPRRASRCWGQLSR